MAVTDTEIYDWQDDFVSNASPGTNPPAATDLIGADLAPDFENIKSVARKESINKSWERWRGLYGTLSYLSATTFKLSGDQRTSNSGPVVVGRRVKCSVTAGTVYGTISAVSFSTDTTCTVSLDSGSLDAGLSEVQFGSVYPGGLFRMGCRITNSIDESVPTGVLTALTFDTDIYDRGDLHSTSVNPGRITLPQSGIWHVFASAAFEANATGLRVVDVRLNGATVLVRQSISAITAAAFRTFVAVYTDYDFTAGDYIEAVVEQTSGGALNVSFSNPAQTTFGCSWLG